MLSQDADEKARQRVESIGRHVSPTEARVVDEQGHDVPPGNVGEIILSGETVINKYWNNPQVK